jgi:hypothetical protein
MSALREAFTEQQIELVQTALEAQMKRHKGFSKMTKGSGYGKATTLRKAEEHAAKAEEYQEVLNYIAHNWD